MFPIVKARALWIAAGLVAFATAGFAYFQRAQDAATAPQFTTARVYRGDLVRTVNATGQLAPSISVEVSTQISGLVTEVNADFNSQVKKGDVLARIDPSTYEQRLRQARADLEAARATHALALIKAQRLKELRDQDLITQQEYDEVGAQLRQSRAALLTQEAAVENARVDLARCTITSPIDGTVIFRQVEVGKTVAASLSAPTLFVIARDLSKMRIVAPINEVDVWSVRPGQAVTFSIDALPQRTFDARVVQIRSPYSPSDKPSEPPQQKRIASFDAVIEVDNRDRLLQPSLTAMVSIIVARRENVLQIPNGALRMKLPPPLTSSLLGSSKSDPSTAIVYRLPASTPRGATPEPVIIRRGESNSMVTEVSGGLKEGDSVVTGVAMSMEEPRQSLFF